MLIVREVGGDAEGKKCTEEKGLPEKKVPEIKGTQKKEHYT